MNAHTRPANGQDQTDAALAASSRSGLVTSSATGHFPARYDAPSYWASSLPMDGGARVKLETDGMPIPEVLSFAQLLLTKMEGNPNFPDPQPPQDELAAVLADAKASTAEAEALRTAFRAAISRRDEIIDRLLAAISQRGSYVQMKSCGNPAKILSAGIDVRRERRPVGSLPPPQGLRVELNGVASVMIVLWDKVKHARGYMIEYGPVDGPTIQKMVNGQRKLRLENMEVGVAYRFRVCAIGGASGQSAWGPWAMRNAA